MRKDNAFTITELLISILIVSILVTIAVPLYSKYIIKSRRQDAKETLVTIQIAEENHRVSNASYSSSVYTDTDSIQGFYTINITTNTDPNYYRITATAKSGTTQTDDTGCTEIVLEYTNGETIKSPTNCWGQ